MDHCYTVIKDLYPFVPRAALRLSDHRMIHLILTYSQKNKAAKPVVKTKKRWAEQAKTEQQACFDCTDGIASKGATTNLDELTGTVTSYISFFDNMCVPTKTFSTYNTNKPWLIVKFKQLQYAKEETYRNGDRIL